MVSHFTAPAKSLSSASEFSDINNLFPCSHLQRSVSFRITSICQLLLTFTAPPPSFSSNINIPGSEATEPEITQPFSSLQFWGLTYITMFSTPTAASTNLPFSSSFRVLHTLAFLLAPPLDHQHLLLILLRAGSTSCAPQNTHIHLNYSNQPEIQQMFVQMLRNLALFTKHLSCHVGFIDPAT